MRFIIAISIEKIIKTTEHSEYVQLPVMLWHAVRLKAALDLFTL